MTWRVWRNYTLQQRVKTAQKRLAAQHGEWIGELHIFLPQSHYNQGIFCLKIID